MERSGAARRYATAIFEIARDSGTIAQWRSDLADVQSVLADSALAPVLANARQGREPRYRMLERVLDISPLAMNFARLLVAKGRTLEAGHIAQEFSRLADAHEGLATAHVITAVELPPGRADAIAARLSAATGKSVQLSLTVDPAILGGIIVRVGDELADGSVRTRLQQLRRHLEGAA